MMAKSEETLIRFAPNEQMILCHVELHKENIKDKKVLCFFSQCAIMSCQTLNRSGAFPGKVQGKWIVKSQPPKFQ